MVNNINSNIYSVSFAGRKKKRSSSESCSTPVKPRESDARIDIIKSRSDYQITSSGNFICNHHREGRQIKNTDYFDCISVTPMESQEDFLYDPTCDCFLSSDDIENKNSQIPKVELEKEAGQLSTKILGYILDNEDLINKTIECKEFLQVIYNDYDFLKADEKKVIEDFMEIKNDKKEENYSIYHENLSSILKKNKTFYKYCQQQSFITIVRKNSEPCANKDLILEKLNIHKNEIEFLWANVSSMTSIFKGIFTNFIDIDDLPCCCCGKALNEDNITVEHIRPHSEGKKLMKNFAVGDENYQILNQKFNSPRNFIFEHQKCNENRGHKEFVSFIYTSGKNFGKNIINNINSIVEKTRSNVELANSLKSFNRFVVYNLNQILELYNRRPKIMNEVLLKLNSFDENKVINKDFVKKEVKNIIEKNNINNCKLINSIYRNIEYNFKDKELTILDYKNILQEEIQADNDIQNREVIKNINKLLMSKKIENPQTKEELENILSEELDLSNEQHPLFIKEIKYLYNQYCVLKYYPPVISKTIYRETGGKINIGLSSWANLLNDIETDNLKPSKKSSFNLRKSVAQMFQTLKSYFYSTTTSTKLSFPRM